MRNKWTAVVVGWVVVLAGCASLESYDKKVSGVQAASEFESLDSAIAKLDATATSPESKKDLLYNMERGELLRMNGQYAQSTNAFLRADELVSAWEDTAKSQPEKILGLVGASLISERLKTYEGQDYEKVMLTTRLALNRIAMGDWDTARVDIKRTHEREAVIAELRAKEVDQAEQEAKSRYAIHCPKSSPNFRIKTQNVEENNILHDIFRMVSHFPRYISETRLPLGQCRS